MKKSLLTAALCVSSVLSMSGAVFVNDFSTGFADDGVIPDGNTSPWSDTRSLSGMSDPISSVSVHVNVSGGFNGDLYAYLSHDNVVVPLMNRVGVGTGNDLGYMDSGFDVVFSDAAANNIHFYQAVPSFNILGASPWRPDGRTLNPVSAASSAFDAPGTSTLGSFIGVNPNGDWTLVIADVSTGGQATLVGWGLSVTTLAAVPEPSEWAALTGFALLGGAIYRRVRKNAAVAV